MNQENLKYLRLYETIKRNMGCTPKSIEAIIWTDLRLFAEFLGEKPFYDVTTQDVEEFFTYCFNERGNCVETVSRKQSSLNTFYDTMIKREYFHMKNPLDKIDAIKFDVKPREYLTKEEFKTYVRYLQRINDLRGLAYVMLTYSSACRISEILGLNRDSLDYQLKRFKVLGKGQKYRYCIFSKEAGEVVKKYLATRKDNNPALFYSRNHQRWAKESAERFVRNSIKAAGITKRITPHCLRHTRAMHLLEDGVSIYEIQKILGHSSIASTQIYAKMSLDQAQASVERFDNQNKWLE